MSEGGDENIQLNNENAGEESPNVDASPEREPEQEGEDEGQNPDGEEREPREGEEGEEGEKKEGEEGEDGEKKEEEEDGEPKPDPNAEKKRIHEILKTGLSQIAKTFDNSAYAYTKLDLNEKELKELFDLLKNYPHLKYINIAQNEIQDIQTVASIPHLLSLNASTNLINSLEVFTNPNVLPFLQILNLSNNKIKHFPAIQLPRLKKLNLNENGIDSCEDLQGHPALEVLELRKNKLKSCDGIKDMPKLRELYLAENKIKDLHGLDNLPSLQTLHLRQNLIKRIMKPFPELTSLHHFNLRENRIAEVKQIKKFKYFTSLKSATIIGNPVIDELGDSKKELIILLPQLTRINKEEVTAEDREEAAQEVRDRIAAEEERLREEEERRKEEEERLREEEEERKRVEAEAAATEAEAQAQAKAEAEAAAAANNEGAEGATAENEATE